MNTSFSRVEDLPWLPPPPADFRRRVRALEQREVPHGADLRNLATFALDLNQLIQLERGLTNIEHRLDPRPLSGMRLAVIADATTEFAAPAIRASGLRHGVHVSLFVPGYGQGMREILDPQGDLAAFGADAALIAQDHRSIGLVRVELDPSRAEEAVSAAMATTATLVQGLESQGIRNIVLQTLPIPPEPWCGHLDRRAAGSIVAQIHAYNERLCALAAEKSLVLLDIDALAALVGRSRWFDHTHYHRAKLPFSMDLVPLYADHVARVLGAMRGKARKCLVLDLDNTLWAGVLGDDGVEGIRIGQGSPEGESHLAVQAYALQLKARGVILAVCSKNEEAVARAPFQRHPDMLLREEDFAVFIANWDDKASNLQRIASSLNIGLDALAFLDDNPAERERVRQMLPEVAVPELPEDPAWFPAALAQAGYFETVGISADDALRADQYRANARRSLELERIGDYDAYLESLDMSCEIQAFDEIGRTRIAQLINKTNQFNLTTRRYTEADVAAMEKDPAVLALQVRLSDRFGDNGMISVVIFRKEEVAWRCDTWLMSCRVIGRRVEEAVLAAVVAAASAEGAKRLVGDYLPTPKNKLVRDHFAKLGFAEEGPVEEEGSEGTRWSLELADYVAPDLPMAITGDFAPAPPAADPH